MDLILYYFIAFAFGILTGNFTTTAYYRLPRNITIFGFDPNSNQPPACSICFTRLKFYEYLPLLSWISTLGHCNYCGVKIDKTYLYLEVTSGFISVLLYSILGFSEHYILLMILITTTLLQVALYITYNKIWNLTIAIQVISGIIIRTLTDGTIFNWSNSLLLSLFIFIAAHRKLGSQKELIVIISLGACLTITELSLYAVIFYLLILLIDNRRYIYKLATIYGMSITILVVGTACKYFS